MSIKLFIYLLLVVLAMTSCSNNSSDYTNNFDNTINIENIILNKTHLTVKKGYKEILVATVLPSDATNKQVEWHSDNDNIVSVSSNGEILAKNTGQANISARTSDNQHEATCSINVFQNIENISFPYDTITIRKGETKQLDIDIVPSNAEENIFWESSNPEILTISNSGAVTGMSFGIVTVSVTNEDSTIIDSCIIKVATPPTIYKGYECVDLGLPSGTLWAKYNIGANSESQAGTYFYWGEVSNNETGQSIYYIPEKRYTDEQGFEHTIPASYKELGNIQGTQYDAAHTIMGGNWMIPEKSDMDELWKNTTYEEVEKDGMRGLKFTGKNGNYIFIPAAGAMYPNGSYAEEGIKCCITIATSQNEKKCAGFWGHTMSNAYGVIYTCEEREFRHQVRGIVKQWY